MTIKFYGMIKGWKLAAGNYNKRVNPIVELLLQNDDWEEISTAIDDYCSVQGISFIAFYPYGSTESGKQRYDDYLAEQSLKSANS